ncbi:MAG TPA: hypothetical protein VFE62_20645 [Gemmataceae bacterium]|nr:hypothetical protein [Gemmataceae bacterium]
MRSKISMLGLILIASTTGCESTRWNWLKKDSNIDIAKPGPSNTSGLVAYLNDNAHRVKTMQIEDMSIDLTSGTQSFGLTGRIFAERPRSFRMMVYAVGKTEVDIGSNANEFWFWAAKNPDPYQYFCSYKDLSDGRIRMMPLPIQPEWVMETLGIGSYGPADKFQLEADPDPKLLRLVEKTKSPRGDPVRKVIVMNRKEVRAPQPQVTAFLLLDDRSGQEICSAQILSTRQDGATGAILPYKMEIRVPAQKMKLTLKLDGSTTNRQLAGTPFSRPQMTGVEAFNLATGRTESPGTQRVGAP